MDYPDWSYFPRSASAPQWVIDFAEAVRRNEERVASASHNEFASDQVLETLRPELEALGWSIETGKKSHQKIHRPVLFGDRNQARVKYEIDGWHELYGAVLEVESGRGWQGNAFFRDLIRTSLISGARYLVIGLRLSYTYGNVTSQNDFERGRDQLDALYASGRLVLPFEGVLIFGW
jgi:hypothetical protein